MANLTDVEAQVRKLAAWQYLNAATFIGVVILVVMAVL